MIRRIRFHQWQANLRVLDVTEIKTVPRFLGRICLSNDRNHASRVSGLFIVLDGDGSGTEAVSFQGYNGYRTHSSLEGNTPVETPEARSATFKCHRWQKHGRGLYQTPIAA